MKFLSSSPSITDLQNKYSTSKLEILMKNVLYLTHEVDQIKKIVTATNNTINLQKQVDEFFEEDQKDIPEDST